MPPKSSTGSPMPRRDSCLWNPGTMPVGYLGQRFPGLTVRARGGTGPYRITGTNLLGLVKRIGWFGLGAFYGMLGDAALSQQFAAR